MACPSGADRLWGPRVDERCRTFDFTLLFEDSILGCVPPAMFLLLLLPITLWNVRRQPIRRQPIRMRETRWIAGKLVGLMFIIPSWARGLIRMTPGDSSSTAGVPDCVSRESAATAYPPDPCHDAQWCPVGGVDGRGDCSVMLAAQSLRKSFSPAWLVPACPHHS